MRAISAKGLALLAGLVLVLSGCSSNSQTASSTSPAQMAAQQQAILDADLNAAAQSVSDSLSQLAEIEKANNQAGRYMPFDNIQDQALSQPVVVNWYGPIAPVLETIASKAGYKLQVYGKPPQTPVLVNIDTTQAQTSALDAIRNLDLQAGQNADILIYPNIKVISLRYTAT
jgi:defect-in-organelle-trafficking protein DotD